MTAALDPSHARNAYAALAPFYDELTAHHRSDDLATAIETLAVETGLPGRRLLDVGCGTGKSFLPFLDRGYAVTACDLSAAMLERAGRKAGGRVPLLRRDMRALGEVGRFDLITCLTDAVNYLHDRSELEAAFGGMRANLAPGGVLVFDVLTLGSFRLLHGGSSVIERPGLVLLWQGRADAPPSAGALASAAIDAFVEEPGASWRRAHSRHWQRHHPPGELRSALRAAGFGWVRSVGLAADGRVERVLDEERHAKAVVLARASAPDSEGR